MLYTCTADITCCTILICTRCSTIKAYVVHVSVCNGDYGGYEEFLPYTGDPCTRGYNVTLIQLLPLYHMMLPPLSADSLLPPPAAHRLFVTEGGTNVCSGLVLLSSSLSYIMDYSCDAEHAPLHIGNEPLWSHCCHTMSRPSCISFACTGLSSAPFTQIF